MYDKRIHDDVDNIYISKLRECWCIAALLSQAFVLNEVMTLYWSYRRDTRMMHRTSGGGNARTLTQVVGVSCYHAFQL